MIAVMGKSDVIRSKKERTQVSSLALIFSSVSVRISATKSLLDVLAWLQLVTEFALKLKPYIELPALVNQRSGF